MPDSDRKHLSNTNEPLTLEALATLADSRRMPGPNYGGDITVQEAWGFLSSHNNAVMVDVRTQPEWQFVGVPDMMSAQGKMIALSWKHYPSFAVNTEFANQLRNEGCSNETPLFFLCRSGGRSLDAAAAMTDAGFKHCFNIIDGFEGEPDATRHRGMQGGWKAAGLPWMQA